MIYKLNKLWQFSHLFIATIKYMQERALEGIEINTSIHFAISRYIRIQYTNGKFERRHEPRIMVVMYVGFVRTKRSLSATRGDCTTHVNYEYM